MYTAFIIYEGFKRHHRVIELIDHGFKHANAFEGRLFAHIFLLPCLSLSVQNSSPFFGIFEGTFLKLSFFFFVEGGMRELVSTYLPLSDQLQITIDHITHKNTSIIICQNFSIGYELDRIRICHQGARHILQRSDSSWQTVTGRRPNQFVLNIEVFGRLPYYVFVKFTSVMFYNSLS